MLLDYGSYDVMKEYIKSNDIDVDKRYHKSLFYSNAFDENSNEIILDLDNGDKLYISTSKVRGDFMKMDKTNHRIPYTSIGISVYDYEIIKTIIIPMEIREFSLPSGKD